MLLSDPFLTADLGNLQWKSTKLLNVTEVDAVGSKRWARATQKHNDKRNGTFHGVQLIV